jgi:hypothetical protein
MIWGITEVEGWFFSHRWNYYQQRKKNVSSYIEKYFGFYRVHVTYAGALGLCDIEYRNEDFETARMKAEELLEKYQEATKEEIQNDYYSPHNPEGYWQTVYNKR